MEEHRQSQLAANALKKEMSILAPEPNEVSGKQEESAGLEKIAQEVLLSPRPSDGGEARQLESIFGAKVQPPFDALMRDGCCP